MLPDKTEPSRIDAVECPETSLGIPPAFGLCSEAADFPGIDGVVGPAQHFLSWPDQYIRLNEFNRRKKMMGLCRCSGNMGAVWWRLAVARCPRRVCRAKYGSHSSKIRRHFAHRCRSHQECGAAGQTRSQCRERGGGRRFGDGGGNEPTRRLDAPVKPGA